MSVDNDIISIMRQNTIFCPYIPKMSLILGESKVHGVKYYTVKTIFADWRTLEKWAFETYDEPSSIWETDCGRWYMNDSMFWFRNESDCSMFVLRWS